MITTRNADVARACCSDDGFIYTMNTLGEEDSRKLFFNRIFGPKRASSEISQFIEVSCEILKKCGGLPLAIISIASILACQPIKLKEQWEYIHNSLAAEFGKKSNIEEMMHILDLSYKNLPHHLRACFLYLGTYPEDHKISKVELVRRWVAEGFVSNSRLDGWYFAENCFNELVNRSMIQPAYEDDYDNEVSHCRVHDMMLELIVRRCKEENFMCFAQDQQVMAKGKDTVVRRLTVKCSIAEDTGAMATTRHLSQVRSLSIFGGPNWMHLVQVFKLLRVLYLDIYRSEMTIDLSAINLLAQLRYLKVQSERSFGGVPILLPSQIRSLKHLETFELPALSVCNIPSDIVHLRCLSHLVVPHDTILPDGIAKIKSLRTLDGFDLSRSSFENINCLGELTNLRNLSIHCHTESWDYANALGASLHNLSNNLNALSVSCAFVEPQGIFGSLEEVLLAPRNLELLYLSGCTFKQIPCFGKIKLKKLRLEARLILEKDICKLGQDLSSSLVQLHLVSPSAMAAEPILILGSMGFSQLKVFELECKKIPSLTFCEGAMPNLQKLSLAFDPSAWRGFTPDGLQHLTRLKEIHVLTVRNNSISTAVSKAPSSFMSTAGIRARFQKVANAHPGHPEFTLGEAWLIRAMESWRTL